MKIITLNIKDFLLENGADVPVEKVFSVEIPYTQNNMEWAKKRSVDGKIAVIDKEERPTPPSQLDIIEAQITYTAMMTNTLLEV